MPDLDLPGAPNLNLAPDRTAEPSRAETPNDVGADAGLDPAVVRGLADARQVSLAAVYGSEWQAAGERFDRSYATDGPAAYERLETEPEAYGVVVGERGSAARAAGTLWAREQVLAEARGEPLPEAYANDVTRDVAMAGQEHERVGGWARQQDRELAERIDGRLEDKAEALYNEAADLQRDLAQTTDANRIAELTADLADVQARRDQVGDSRRELAEIGAANKTFRFEGAESGASIAHSSLDAASGEFIIRHDGTLGNQVHELTHAHQYATGVTSFPSSGGTSFHGVAPVDTEVQAYRRQYAADPDSLPRTSDSHPSSLSEITPDYVRGIYTRNIIGVKDYYYRTSGY